MLDDLTWIEVMIAVAIIGLIAAIAIPNLTNTHSRFCKDCYQDGWKYKISIGTNVDLCYSYTIDRTDENQMVIKIYNHRKKLIRTRYIDKERGVNILNVEEFCQKYFQKKRREEVMDVNR